MKLIDCLDRGYVALHNSMGDDKTVADAARVSYASAKTRSEDERLIAYLLKNKHTSPFEMVEFAFEVKAPLFVTRQWQRHRMASYNEVSARYSEMLEEFYTPAPEDIRGQGAGNKQVGNGPISVDAQQRSSDRIRVCAMAQYRAYLALLEDGVCREQARMVLPVNLYTKFIYKVDLNNLLKFIELRAHPHAQYEMQVYAEGLLELIKPIVPITISTWTDLRST